jgi:hypothetical protein
MLQLVGLFGLVCAGIGGFRIYQSAKAPDPKKAKANGIGIVIFATFLIGISLFGAPIAMRLSGL